MRNYSEEIRQDAREQAMLIMALNMLKLGKNSLEDIVKVSGLTENDVRELAAHYNVPIMS